MKLKQQLNVVAIGGVGTGKSTAVGQIIHTTGAMSAREFLKQGQERSSTIDSSMWPVEGEFSKINLIDAPGNPEFIERLISSTSQGDAALLFIDASKEGTDDECEHAYIAYAMGVRHLIVVVNKMDDDAVDFSEDRFKEIRGRILPKLQQLGYNPMHVVVVPISGLKNDNIAYPSQAMSWYDGHPLLGALDSLKQPRRLVTKPLRVPIQNVRYVEGEGTWVDGCVETGSVESEEVRFSPSGIQMTFRSVEENHEALPMSDLGAGKILSFLFGGKLDDQIFPGQVMSDTKSPAAQEVSGFEAQIIVVNHPGEISVGYTPIIDVHTAHTPCTLVGIKKSMDRRTGKLKELNPTSVREGDACIVELQPQKPVSLERFADFPPLGRFVVRDGQRIVGVGVVKSVKYN